MHKIAAPFGSFLCSRNDSIHPCTVPKLSDGFSSPFKTNPISLSYPYRVRLRDPARSLQDSVALPEVAPPHVLVGDLNDVSHGEPALLSIRQADALVHG